MKRFDTIDRPVSCAYIHTKHFYFHRSKILFLDQNEEMPVCVCVSVCLCVRLFLQMSLDLQVVIFLFLENFADIYPNRFPYHFCQHFSHRSKAQGHWGQKVKRVKKAHIPKSMMASELKLWWFWNIPAKPKFWKFQVDKWKVKVTRRSNILNCEGMKKIVGKKMLPTVALCVWLGSISNFYHVLDKGLT